MSKFHLKTENRKLKTKKYTSPIIPFLSIFTGSSSINCCGLKKHMILLPVNFKKNSNEKDF